MSDRDGIQKLGPQHYKVVVDLPPDPGTGKRRRKSKAVHGPLSAAKEARRAMLGLRDTGRLVGTSDQKLGAYLRSWLEAKRGEVADSTWQRYDSLMRSAIIPALGGVKLRDLNVQHLRDYFATCRTEPSPRRKGECVSTTTVHHRWVVLKAALAQAVNDGLIPADALYERSGTAKFSAPRGKRRRSRSWMRASMQCCRSPFSSTSNTPCSSRARRTGYSHQVVRSWAQWHSSSRCTAAASTTTPIAVFGTP